MGTRGALVVLALTLTVLGCNEVPPDLDAGGIGIGVDDAGQPVLFYRSCASSLTEATVVQGREGLDPDQENVLVGEWTIQGADGQVHLASAETEGEFLGFQDDILYLVDVTLADPDLRLLGVAFELGDLAALGADEVLVGDAETVDRSELGSCAADGLGR